MNFKSLKNKNVLFIVLTFFFCFFLISCNSNSNPPTIPNSTNTNSSLQSTTQTPVTTTQTPVIITLTAVPTSSPTSTKNITPDPKNENIYNNAYNSFHSGKYSEAINLANKVLETEPNHYKALNIKGIALSFQNNYNEGMKNIDASLAINGDYWYGRFNKALAYKYNEELDNALLWFDKSLEKENYVWSYYGKACCYGIGGDITNTVKNLRIAIEMDKVVIDLAKTQKDFNKVRTSQEFQTLIK
jgi:tetratricopeptide (TPR) repeat protein